MLLRRGRPYLFRMRRVLAGGILALAVVGLSGCALANKQLRDEQTIETGVTSVTINGGGGSVRITGSSPDASVHVKRHVRYRNQKPGATTKVDAGALTLNTSCGAICWVDYDVTAPKGITVGGRNGSGDVFLSAVSNISVEVGSGRIDVRNASGNVSARTGSGDIDVSGVTGAVVCRAGSGDVQLRNVASDAVAETGSGDINATDLSGAHTSTHTGSGDVTLRLSTAQDVDVNTGSGDVRITVPGGQGYRLAVSTSSGDTHLGVSSDPSADHQIKVHTGSGDVTLNHS
jgi:Toastrack DUF4097